MQKAHRYSTSVSPLVDNVSKFIDQRNRWCGRDDVMVQHFKETTAELHHQDLLHVDSTGPKIILADPDIEVGTCYIVFTSS